MTCAICVFSRRLVFFWILFLTTALAMVRLMVMRTAITTISAVVTSPERSVGFWCDCKVVMEGVELFSGVIEHLMSLEAFPLSIVAFGSRQLLLQGLHFWWIWSLKVPSGQSLQERLSVGSWPFPHS